MVRDSVGFGVAARGQQGPVPEPCRAVAESALLLFVFLAAALLPACSGLSATVPARAQEPVPAPGQHVGEGVVGQPPVNPPIPAPANGASADRANEPELAPEDDYAAPRAPTKRTWIYVGYRSVDEAFWSPVEDQITIGFEVTRERPGKLFGGEAGMNLGIGTGKIEGFDAESSVIEFYAGLRKTWGDLDQRWHPYIGFGGSALRASVQVSDFDLGDWGFAGYAHAGVHYDVTDRMSVGIDVRSLFASSVKIGGLTGDVDYTQVALALGWLF